MTSLVAIAPHAASTSVRSLVVEILSPLASLTFRMRFVRVLLEIFERCVLVLTLGAVEAKGLRVAVHADLVRVPDLLLGEALVAVLALVGLRAAVRDPQVSLEAGVGEEGAGADVAHVRTLVTVRPLVDL